MIHNVKAALGTSSKSTETPETSKDESNAEDSKESHKKYYHTVTGASSRKSSPITRVMDIFWRKPHVEANQPVSDPAKKNKNADKTSPIFNRHYFTHLS